MGRREKGTGTWGKVTKKGVEYYRFRKVYENGFRKEFIGKTKTAVKQKIEEYEKKDVKISDAEYNKMTFGECIDRVLTVVEPTLKVNNYATLRSTYRCYVKTNDIRNVQMGNIDSQIIQQYYFELAKKYSSSTVKKTRTLFNVVLNYLVDTKVITANPATGIRMPHKTNYAVKPKKHSFLSIDDAEKFYETALIKATESTPGVKTGEFIYGRNALFCIIVAYTGMRIGEAYALRWKDIDFNKDIIHIKNAKERVKNEETGEYEWIVDTVKKESSVRIIPIANKAKRALTMLKYMPPENKKENDFIFVTANNIPPSQSSLTRTLHAILDRAGIESKGFGLHDLRHSFGSMLLEKGWRENKPVDIKVISELLGHKDISTTYNIYTHVLQQHKVEAISLFD